MTRVLVNDHCLLRTRTGVGQYLASLVAHWPEKATIRLEGIKTGPNLPEVAKEYARSQLPDVAGIEQVTLRPLTTIQTPRPSWKAACRALVEPAWYALKEQRVRQQFKRGGYDSFFEPNNIPIARLEPTVTAMMDLSVLEVPQFHPANRISFWTRRLGRAVLWTKHWTCISQATARALTRVLGVPADQTTVTPLASRWDSVPVDWTPRAVRAQLGLGNGYLLHLGTIEPRKNLLLLLDAYERLPAEQRRRWPLIFAGSPGWGDESFWTRLREHPVAGEVSWTGYVSDTQAAALIRGASTLLYPSLYEGFGLPPLEAMALGVPAVCSPAESLQEVCGDAAPLVGFDETEAWSEWMLRMPEPGAERDEWIRRGHDQARTFQWSHTAKLQHDVMTRHAA
ncbi:GDP-mannose-dependent alpha-(1-2)-phosphatidylinositol mannosyltransferase [Planctomycetes bacterium Pan216]|uniref:GDP-mannose-dependent alpha-(1-2)-phosphatidylinositol mannosyltransferase n=1 Tax=Kolteria novifilia TaxID=2527975 RepID=A0A518B1X3_9BACT|nr:GDP-mannose-dependent alpha-(1-2)-phosphatidylinositol mannosyltransferase [Planctomycetes bacterium Pan216]